MTYERGYHCYIVYHLSASAPYMFRQEAPQRILCNCDTLVVGYQMATLKQGSNNEKGTLLH